MRNGLFANALNVGLAMIALLGGMSAREAQGWGEDGHRTVAAIAEKNLKPATLAKLKTILGLHSSESISADDIAMWADHIKGQRPYTKPWHYADIPVYPNVIYQFDPQRDGNNGNCVVFKIQDFIAAAKSPSTSPSKRREALKFLIHFVGDIHQPLHCAERSNDRGGNGQNVIILNKFKNLHEVWDYVLVDEQKGSQSLSAYAQNLNASITQAQRATWTSGGINTVTWINEGHAVAVNVVYTIGTADPETLSTTYVATGKTTVDEQIKKAGIRLAMVLEEALR